MRTGVVRAAAGPGGHGHAATEAGAAGATTRSVLIPPKILKPSCGQFGIFNRVLDVAMPQEELNSPRILLVVRQFKAAAMPQLMGVHRETQLGHLTRLRDHLADARIRERAFALREKDGDVSQVLMCYFL
jgi:predicted DNA-binding protein (UPF0251 family)